MQKDAKIKIQALISKYEAEKSAGKINKYTEEETKKDFIIPLFEALGWNVYDKNEVTAEETISSDRVDYGFYINNRIKFYLEAKPLKADLHRVDYAEQAIRYSWNKGVTWAILTDFESLIVFNALSPEKSLAGKKYLSFTCDEYLTRFEELWRLSKESFGEDILDKEAEKVGKKLQKVSVTETLAKDLNDCREILRGAFLQWNEKVDPQLIEEGVQKLLNRLIFIRCAEDRKIEPSTLVPLIHEWKSSGAESQISPYTAMVKKFRELDAIYNSNLFAEHPFEKWEEFGGATEKVIEILYGKKNYFDYDFSVIPADVLGNVYENYLGHQLKKSKKADSADKNLKKRKEQGIYYTPKFIVDYIVENALGPVLNKCKSINDLQKIKILDPACGSGSFLVVAMNFLIKKYVDFGAKPDGLLKIQILTNNIYGVDLDQQAVELARLNLLLNTFDDQTKLPNLGKNIKNGNSLISGTDEELQKYFGKNYRDKKPFNWQEEFPEVFKQGGFDCIIGNPPYIRVHKLSSIDKKYYWDKYAVFKAKSDIYACFIQKGIDLLKHQGIFSYIVSNTWLTLESFTDLRKYILDNCIVSSLLFPPKKIFQDASVETVVFTFKKEKDSVNRLDNEIEIYDVNNNLYTLKEKINQKNYNDNFNYSFYINQSGGNLFNVAQDKILPLKECIEFVYGFKTGDDEKFLTKDKSTSHLTKKILRRSDFTRYSTFFQGEYIIYDPEAMKKHKKTARPGDRERFEQDKILIQDIGKKIIATLDKDKYYIKDALILLKGGGLSLLYLLALLNSKFINSWYRNKFKVLSVAKNAILEIPIYKIDFSNLKEKARHDGIAKLANKMLDLNEELQNTSENSDRWHKIKDEIAKTDKKIDEEVYKLYGLMEKEIKIVEENSQK